MPQRKVKCSCCKTNPATVKDFRMLNGVLSPHWVCNNCVFLTDEDFRVLRSAVPRDRAFIIRSITDEPASRYRLGRAA